MVLTVVAFGDCTSPSSSSTSTASMSELIMVVSADTADQVRFPLLFIATATWVTTSEAAIFPAVSRVRHDAATLDGTLRDTTGASLSLPAVELETYSSTGGGGTACMSATSRTL
jgi:hypothetical protein